MIEHERAEEAMVSREAHEYSLGALYADYLNRGYRLNELSELTGVSPSTLTNRLKKFFNRGLLKLYYNVIFQRLPIGIRFLAVSLSRRQKMDRCIENKIDLITGFYTPTPTLTYFIYVNQTSSGEIEFNTCECRVLFDENVLSSLIPVENYVEKRIELYEPDRALNYVDDDDLAIVKDILRYYNPPPLGNIDYIKLSKALYSNEEFGRRKMHFYKHVLNKLVVKRVLYREPSSYSITIIYANGLKETACLLNDLVAKGLIKGVDQVNVISLNPFIAIAHCWVNEVLLWDTNFIEEHKGIYRYEVFVVRRMNINGSG